MSVEVLEKEKAVIEQNKAYFCKNSAKLGILIPYKEIILAYDTAIELLEKRYDSDRSDVPVYRV